MIAYPTALAARQRPPMGARAATPVAGGLWLPGPHGVVDAAGCNAPAKIIGGVTKVQGPFGGPALKFDNATGYVDCGLTGNTAFNWSTGIPFSRTFWAWVFRPTSTSAGPVFTKGNNSPNSGWSFSVRNDGYLESATVGASNQRYITTGEAIPANTWVMVGITWNGDVTSNVGGVTSIGVQHYVNGRVMPMNSGGLKGGTNQNANDTFNLYVGGNSQYVGGTGGSWSQWSDLAIDHWGFDHRYYSPQEMADLYARPFRNFAPAPIFGRLRASSGAAARPVMFICT